jgi:tRNA-modifying protein YgfZ
MATTDTLRAEYDALTERCGLIDRSERGKLALTGGGAVEFLNGQVTNELSDLRPGEGRYAAFLTHKGKMLGDLRILALGDDPSGPVTELLLDTERAALQPLFDMIRRYKVGYDVELHKRTRECGLLSLVGPASHACVAELVGVQEESPHTPASGGESPPPASAPAGESSASGSAYKSSPSASPRATATLSEAEHSHLPAKIAETPVRLIATADGVDVLCEAPDLAALQTAILDAGAVAASEAAAEVVRVERGRPRYGLDIDDTTIPQEAGLNERAVSFTKGCYVGQETVARLHYRGKPNRHLRGLRFAAAGETLDAQPAPVAPRPTHGEQVRLGDRPVGHLGSVVESPRLGTIGLALVRREAAPGDVLVVGTSGTTAEVVELPFPT